MPHDARVWGPAPCRLALGLARKALYHCVIGSAGWSTAHTPMVRGSSLQHCTKLPTGAQRETEPARHLTANSLGTPDAHLPRPFPLPLKGTQHWNFQIHFLVSDFHEMESERLLLCLVSFMVLLRVMPLLRRGSVDFYFRIVVHYRTCHFIYPHHY